jgi:hypothetical protein
MSTATDIAALKARCTALEKKDTAIQSAATALAARVAKLEAVKPIDYAVQIAALQKEVDALRYIISPIPIRPGPAWGTEFTDRGFLYLDDGHDLLYENLRFTGNGYGSGDGGALVFLINYSPVYNIVFRNCIFETNAEGTGNGVKLFDRGGGTMSDITFDHCHFEYQPRMALEILGRATEFGIGGQGYLRINTTDCTFDASAGQALSYDDSSNTAGYCTVSGNVIEGAGVGSTYAYGRVFELNKVHNMTVTDNFFGAGRDGIMNLQGDGVNTEGWTFSGNVIDGSHVPPGVTIGGNQPYCCENVMGGDTFSDTIITGSYQNSWGYFANCNGMDFTGSTLSGSSNPPYSGGTNTNMVWPTVI